MTHYGKQQGRLVPCRRSQDHGFHPEGEACDWCDPVRVDDGQISAAVRRLLDEAYSHDMDDYLFP